MCRAERFRLGISCRQHWAEPALYASVICGCCEADPVRIGKSFEKDETFLLFCGYNLQEDMNPE